MAADLMHVVDRQARIFIAGHRGMVGSAIVRHLQALGHNDLLTATHAELDLKDQAAVNRYFASHRIDHVVLAAAKVGGIHANGTYPADFLYDNLAIATNCIHGAYATGVKRVLFLGSSCIYPKFAPQPMPESALMSGALEPTDRKSVV